MEIDLLIERLGIYGEGVAREDGKTVFVDGALPGERVRAKVYEQRKSFSRATVVEMVERSPRRVEPICPLFGRCGGCQIMHLDYQGQLEAKRQRVVDALERIGGLTVEVWPCQGSPLSLAYRNKIQLPVVDGKLGLYAKGSHDLVEVEKCYIHCDLGEKVFHEILRLFKPLLSDLRYVLIKTAVQLKQVLVVLVSAKNEIEGVEMLMQRCPEVKGIVLNVNTGEGNRVLGSEFRVLAGQGWIEERLMGLTFKVSAASFFQVNPAQAEKLYEKVVEFAELSGKERVLDAYCGVGTMALVLAQHAKEVLGVESVPEAIDDAKENGEKNGIKNARFVCGRAEDVIEEAVDVAVLNPPRKGCEEALLQKLQAERVIYVSCDPATLARDLRFLCGRGYAVEAVVPFDMFPQTSHVECVVKLRRKS